MDQKVIFATRAEELGNRVFEYFAMPSESFYSRLLRHKAAVLVGGRGTGKTMLLKSMAFEYRVNNTSSKEAENIWRQDHFLGCYIRADTNIVSSFRGRGIDDETWGLLFAHYFNLRVTQQVVKTLKLALEKHIINDSIVDGFITRYYQLLGEEYNKNSIYKMDDHIRQSLDELVRYINNPRKKEIPELTNNGTLIFECCDELFKNQSFANKVLFILIDEYENLSEDQQRIVNTLIKANQPPVIFKIAMRPGGWWTQQTLALTENLENIADFDLINYQTDFSDQDYTELIIQAFQKSLDLNGIRDPNYLDVRKLLPDISPEDEARQISAKSSRTPDFLHKIKHYITEFTKSAEQREYLKKYLINDEDPLRTRFHLVLLDRGFSPERIVSMQSNKPKQYQELYRHNRIGTLFLFCSDYKYKKLYAGFDTYVLLSSKIMRSFVSLFSRAWELSHEDGFSVQNPRPMDFETQSKAANDVSQGKVFEIVSYPSGPALSSFANQLGRIFEQLNKDIKQSQPERNHFAIIGDLSTEARSLMRSALMYSILQEIPATKLRTSIEIRGRDYIFNRIYCPFYNISYRKMHKLELPSDDFEYLIRGDDQEKRQVASKILKKYQKDAEMPVTIEQMDLFDGLS